VAPEGVEQVELTEPWKAIEKASGTPELISTEVGKVQGFNRLKPADTFDADKSVEDVRVTDYAGLVLPGGVASADILRMNEAAVGFVKGFFDAGLPVAVICHGPSILLDADVVRGRTLTSYPSMQTDIRNAGGNWVDEEVVVDERRGNALVSSRRPRDLPAFCGEMLDAFAA
jgi:protease I